MAGSKLPTARAAAQEARLHGKMDPYVTTSCLGDGHGMFARVPPRCPSLRPRKQPCPFVQPPPPPPGWSVCRETMAGASPSQQAAATHRQPGRPVLHLHIPHRRVPIQADRLGTLHDHAPRAPCGKRKEWPPAKQRLHRRNKQWVGWWGRGHSGGGAAAAAAAAAIAAVAATAACTRACMHWRMRVCACMWVWKGLKSDVIAPLHMM
eukprot:361943-Chlamydomonas_euryale.AAC.1